MIVKKFDCSTSMADDIVTIDKSTFQDISMSPSELCTTFKQWEHYEIYVAYINDIAVGFIGMMKAVTPHYNGWWIDLLAVLPNKQGRGIGSKLVAFVKGKYKLEDNVITALIRKNNIASIKAIERNGFKSDKTCEFGLFILD